MKDFKECRGCGLIGCVWCDGRMFICTETNGFPRFCIGDLSQQTLEEVYTGRQFAEVRARVSAENFKCCPVSCRPTRLNKTFEKIEQLRKSHPKLLEAWITALQGLHTKPNPWIET
jgi:sulfatase maturation enzyme AslB (radical SAM superfamily)